MLKGRVACLRAQSNGQEGRAHAVLGTLEAAFFSVLVTKRQMISCTYAQFTWRMKLGKYVNILVFIC